MTDEDVATERRHDPVSKVTLRWLSKTQKNWLIEFVNSTSPEGIPGQTRDALLSMNLIRPTGPKHCAYHLTARGKDLALVILAKMADELMSAQSTQRKEKDKPSPPPEPVAPCGRVS